MSATWRTLLWALSLSLLLAAVLLFVTFRWLLPLEDGGARTAPYTIGVWEGQVAVFEGAQEFPRQVFDVYVAALPEEVRRRVTEGVPADSEAELSVLLEDYTG